MIWSKDYAKLVERMEDGEKVFCLLGGEVGKAYIFEVPEENLKEYIYQDHGQEYYLEVIGGEEIYAYKSEIFIEQLTAQDVEFLEDLTPLDDPYFEGLDVKAICELAKKSLRLTDQHIKDQDSIDELKAQISKINQERVYTCNCQTPMYKAAPEMYAELAEICRTREFEYCRDNECVFCPIGKVLKKARGEK